MLTSRRIILSFAFVSPQRGSANRGSTFASDDDNNIEASTYVFTKYTETRHDAAHLHPFRSQLPPCLRMPNPYHPSLSTTDSDQDHASALALVSVRSSSTPSSSALQTSTTLDLQSEGAKDPDLRRPHELQTLHDNIKLAYGSHPLSGPTPAIRELQEARSSVNRALERLGLSAVRGETNGTRVHQDAPQRGQQIQQVQQNTHMSSAMNEDDRQDADYDDDEMDAWA